MINAERIRLGMVGAGPTETRIREWLSERVASRARVTRDRLNPDAPLASQGLDSLQIVSLLAELEKWLGRRFVENPLLRHATINALARSLAREAL